jgi:hypothetical protein
MVSIIVASALWWDVIEPSMGLALIILLYKIYKEEQKRRKLEEEILKRLYGIEYAIEEQLNT